jgi:two-component system, response regulator PdtaR
VFNEEYKLIQRMTPLVRKVLIVDPSSASARLLGDLLRNISRPQVWNANTTRRGLETARQVNPQLIFVELSGDDVDGVEFSRQLRRSDMACRQAPVIMVTATATAGAILAARDAGVHEFLRKPYTAKDLLRRLEAVTLRPRDWIEAVHYVGPDRRRFNSGDYSGPLKRRSDAATSEGDRIVQALKILKSAVAAWESDPAQALRSMLAQAAELERAAVAVADPKLAAAAMEFQQMLAGVAAAGPAAGAQIAGRAARLLAFLPKDEGARESAA